MYACFKRSFMVTVSVNFYFSILLSVRLETIWMCEAMYCTVVMPYKNKMSSSSHVLVQSFQESLKRRNGQEHVTVEKFQAFIYKIL